MIFTESQGGTPSKSIYIEVYHDVLFMLPEMQVGLIFAEKVTM